MGLQRTLESLTFAQRLLVFSLIFDPIGAVGGYLLAPQFGLDPVTGLVYGLVLAAIPTAILASVRAR